MLFAGGIEAAEPLRIAALNGTSDLREKRYHGEQLDLVEGASAENATGDPLVRHAYLVAPNILALTIDERHKQFVPMRPYRPQPGDQIAHSGKLLVYGKGLQRIIRRDGKPLGTLVGRPNNELVKSYDIILGNPLDTQWAMRPDSYTLTSRDDSDFTRPATPVNVFRKSKPLNLTLVAPYTVKFPVRHEVYLEFDQPLKSGNTYTVGFEDGSQLDRPITIHFDDKKLRSEAVHVTQTGYAPMQRPKYAQLSSWIGNGGGVDYAQGTPFHLIDQDTGESVYEGTIELVSDGSKPEYTWGSQSLNHNQTNVYRMDFSDFQEPGVYTVSVPGIGTSFPFRIDNQVWEEVTRLYLKGLLQQRNGIALNQPWTDYERPRPMHPDDGFKVHLVKPDVWYHGLDNFSFERGDEAWQAMKGRKLTIKDSPSQAGGRVARTSGMQQDITQVLLGLHHRDYNFSGQWKAAPGTRVVVELDLYTTEEQFNQQVVITTTSNDWSAFQANFPKLKWKGNLKQAIFRVFSENRTVFEVDRISLDTGRKMSFALRQASIDFSKTVPEAWGGWMDAGDFDRRPNHMYVVHSLLTLYESNPDYFSQLDLNIPESDNDLPDIIDEALWGLELPRRIQGVYGPGYEGAVSLRVESVEHPRPSETSWTDSLDCVIDPPSRSHSFIYAAAAAHMASVLKDLDAERSRQYADSALAAYEWATRSDDYDTYHDDKGWPGLDSLRNRAAAYLFKHFQSKDWQAEYIRTMDLDNWHKASDNGALVFSTLNLPGMDPAAKRQSLEALRADGDDLIVGMNEMAYGALRHTEALGKGNLAARARFVQTQEAEALINLWRVTGDEKYLEAATQSLQYAHGNNPMNLAFVSGLGQRHAWPYLLDMRNSDLRPSVGMIIYGPLMGMRWVQSGRHKQLPRHGLFPTQWIDEQTGQDAWPMAEGFIDEFYWAAQSEHTVHQSTQQLLIAGTLAQHFAEDSQEQIATETTATAIHDTNRSEPSHHQH